MKQKMVPMFGTFRFRLPFTSANIVHCCLLAMLAGASLSSAATKTWNGAADPDGNWSNSTNWDAAPASGDDLHFAGSTNLFTTNDLSTDVGGTFTVNSLTFDSGADLFDLSGTAININGKTIANNSSNLQTFSLTLKETGNGFTADGSGDIYLSAINRPSGFGSTITKNGTGKLTIMAHNTSHRINLNDGELIWGATTTGGLYNNVNVHGGVLRCTAGVNSFHFNVNVNLDNSNTSASSPARVNIGAGTTTKFTTFNGVAGSVLSNEGTTGQTSTLMIRGSNTNFAGAIKDGDGGGKTAVTLNEVASSNVTLSGANTFTGNLTVSATYTLNLTGAMMFKPEPGSVSNKITGAGNANLNGTFNIDLGGVGSPADGAAWTLVDVGTLSETFGTSFAVAAPFAETSSGIWSYDTGSGVFTFSESTGQLTFGRIAVSTWDGGASPDTNWSNNANWDQNPASNDLLVFSGSTTANNNDLDTAYDTGTSTLGAFAVGGLRFAPGAAAFTLQGNAVNFSGKSITNDSTNTQAIGFDLQFDNAVGGPTVDAANGDVVINGLALRNGFGTAFTKTGSNKLTINGPLVGADTFGLTLNQGTMEVNTSGNLFFNGTVASGATLKSSGLSLTGVLHNGGNYTFNGTLDLGQGVSEDVGSFQGSGTITNHGVAGTTSAIATGSNSNRTFSGTIKDGTTGGATAVQIGHSGGTDTGVLTLSGANTYSGDTTMAQSEASLALSSTGSLRFKPAASGVSNKIAGAVPQVTGTVQLDGTFFVDLSGASVANGNSWTLVDAANLNDTYGSTFQIVNAAYIPPTSYTVNGGTGVFGSFAEDDTFASGGGNYSNGSAIDTSGVVDPAPAEVYQSERNGNFTYNFGGLGAGASYKVRLHFAEIYHNAAGLRKFNVLINGTTALSDFDVFAEAGARYKAIVREFNVPASVGGAVSIQFVTVTDSAKISGVEIIPLSGGAGSTFTEAADVWTMVDGANTWTFTEATGVLSLATAGGASYSTWAGANGIPGEPASGDFDKDGLSNLEEYALGKNPITSSTPAGTFAGNTITYTKGADAIANGDVDWIIETSTSLAAGSWSPEAAVEVGNTIAYTFTPGTPAKKFARLKVVQTSP